MPPKYNITVNQQFTGTYMNQTIPHAHPVVSQLFSSNFRCDMCRRMGDVSMCYSYRLCDMDIYQICFSKIFYAPQKNRHPHQLLYLAKRKNWYVIFVKKGIKIFLMYYAPCDFDCCTDCNMKGYIRKNDDVCGPQ